MHNTQPTSQGSSPQNRPQGSKPYQGGGGSGYQGNRPWQRREERPYEKGKHRLNGNIRVPEVRVVQDGKQLGIMKTFEAQKLADEAGLDLVEIAPQGQPPVCSIMDYGKFKYEEKIKQKDQDRKQRESAQHLKEIRLTPSIGEHDVEVKLKHCKEFLEDGMRVLIVVKFQKRQLNHKEMGFDVIKKFIAALGDKIVVQSEPRLDGKQISCCVASK